MKVYATGQWSLYRKSEVVLSGTAADEDYFQTGSGVWNRLALEGDEHIIRAYINDTLVGTYEDENPITAGRIALGSAYTFTQFGHLTVKKIEGRIPYYTELIDNMETYDLSPERNDKLIYNNQWKHQNGQGMYVYQRSMSTSTGPGAALSYTFSGTGLEILAGTKKTATLLVSVDDTVISEDALTQTADDMNMVYSLGGLDYGTHTVTLEVIDGVLSVDMVGVLGQGYEKPAPTIPPSPATTPVPSPPAAGQGPAASQEQTVPTAAPSMTSSPEPSGSSLKKGSIVVIGQAKYQITNTDRREVSYKQPLKKTIKKASVPDKVLLTMKGKRTAFRVTAISNKAFSKCRKLKSIHMGKNLRTIGKNALKGIHKKAVITCSKKKLSSYKKLLKKKTGFAKTMKLKAK